MSRTLKVTGNHVMYDRGAWFLRVVMSILYALCCLPSLGKQKHDFHFVFVQYVNKTILDSVFVIPRIIKVLVRFIASAFGFWLMTPYLDLDYSRYHKTPAFSLSSQSFVKSRQLWYLVNIISSTYLDSWRNESSQQNLAEKPANFTGCRLLDTTLKPHPVIV